MGAREGVVERVPLLLHTLGRDSQATEGVLYQETQVRTVLGQSRGFAKRSSPEVHEVQSSIQFWFQFPALTTILMQVSSIFS